MNIVLGEANAQALRDRYMVLPLDAFLISGQATPVQSFCVIESVPLAELPQSEQWRELHENLMRNYGLKNWNYCEQALEHLQGKWNGAIDSFYQDLSTRVTHFKAHDPGEHWTPVVIR